MTGSNGHDGLRHIRRGSRHSEAIGHHLVTTLGSRVKGQSGHHSQVDGIQWGVVDPHSEPPSGLDAPPRRRDLHHLPAELPRNSPDIVRCCATYNGR